MLSYRLLVVFHVCMPPCYTLVQSILFVTWDGLTPHSTILTHWWLPIGLQWYTGSIFGDMVMHSVEYCCSLLLVVSYRTRYKIVFFFHMEKHCTQVAASKCLFYSTVISGHCSPRVEQAAVLLPVADVCFHISAPFMLALASCWAFLLFPNNNLIPL